jgi:membrane-associated phospholipid phosphatase
MALKIKGRMNKFFAALALFSVELIIIWILFFGCIIVFAVTAYRIFLLKKDSLDNSVFNFVANSVSPGHTQIMEFITYLATPAFLIAANLILITYFLFIKKHKWYSIQIPVVAIGGMTLMLLLKDIFSRPRPLIPLLEPAKGFSFPSGHAMMSFSFYGLLIYMVYENVRNPYLKWILITCLFILIFLIGFSRVYLRVHYASDVIAGFAAGFIWIVLSLYVIVKIEKFSERKLESTLDPNSESKSGTIK